MEPGQLLALSWPLKDAGDRRRPAMHALLTRRSAMVNGSVSGMLTAPTTIMFARTLSRLPRLPPIAFRNISRQCELPALRRMASTLPRLPVFEAIASHDPQSTAVIHSVSGRRFSYGELLSDVADAKQKLLAAAGPTPIDGQRIAFLVENGYDYVGAHT